MPNQKGSLLIIILVFILLVGVGIGAYYLGSLKNNSIPTQQVITYPSPSLIPTASPISPASAEATNGKTYADSQFKDSDWVEYKNSQQEFSFSYPKSWTQSGPVSKEDSTIAYLHSNETFGEESEPIRYYIWITKTNKLPEFDMTSEKLGNYKVYKTTQLPAMTGSLTAFITDDDKRYITISIQPYELTNPYPSQDKYMDIFNKILFSFKFIQ